MWLVAWLWMILGVGAAGQAPAVPCGSPNLMFVSTLDGDVTAIDAATGMKKWSFQSGNPLLSSNIHQLELSNSGQWMRLVPSLSGSLYRFSHDTLEPLPITADQLLSSSFKYSNDLVIAGAKESSSFGLSTLTGQILYECNLKGCVNTSEVIDKDAIYKETAVGTPTDVLVIRSISQTVRAFEPRTGHEKWNFSVGQHDLTLQPHENCIDSPSMKVDLVYKVIVPEGLICALEKNAPHNIVWQIKLDTPIVDAWKVEGNQLKAVDLFAIPLPIQSGFHPQISPAIYIGMHERQLYIQESVRMQTLIHASYRSYLGSNKEKQKIILPWRPIPAQSLAEWKASSNTQLNKSNKEYSTTALAILYASEYVNDNGFYLYTDQDHKQISDLSCTKKNSKIADFLKYILYKYKPPGSLQIDDQSSWDYDRYMSILYWWKELLLIFIGTLFLYHYMYKNYLKVKDLSRESSPRVVIDQPNRDTPETQPVTPIENVTPPPDLTPPPFVSHYLNDFTPIRCLGHGGFGIVFEAKNKIDDASYAIKRITLPNKQEKRDRVLREVRALARLEHVNIVRYFHSWLEEPPIDWQDPNEIEFRKNEEHSELPSDSFVHTNAKSSVTSSNAAAHFKFKRDATESFRQRSYSVNDSFSIQFKSNSNVSESFCKVTNDDVNHASFYIGTKDRDVVDGNSVSVPDCETNGETSSAGIQSETCEIVDEVFKKKTHRRNYSLDLRKTKAEQDKSPPCGKIYLYIQMQLCQDKSLREWLRENNHSKIKRSDINKMFEQIVSAVEYIHTRGLIHRDLKPSNIFFSAEGLIKVGDFGLVTTIADPLSNEPNRSSFGPYENGGKHTQNVGTYLYMSPEQLRGEQHDFKVDIWSLGLVFLELLIDFGTEMERIHTLKSVRENKFPPNFNKKFPEEHSLLQIMLSQEPTKRPSTFGIRRRPPLLHKLDDKYDFTLPPRLPRNSFSV